MAKTRFLVNMNISPKTVATLQQYGWDIIRVSDLSLVNATDEEILELPRWENRVVLTQDLDFSALLALGGYNRSSPVTLRLLISDPETVSQRLLQALPRIEESLRLGCAAMIEDAVVRIRQLPIE